MPNNVICIHLYTTCIIYFSVKAAKDESPLLRGPAHADAKRAELSISQPTFNFRYNRGTPKLLKFVEYEKSPLKQRVFFINGATRPVSRVLS